ncbi:uncharacterized protein [Patagioenas fasciata]|uniref:uncharacterized protein isoform X2 n=1 Tax=Patagioenas fasciata TaxID=372321 RepID=UPI003A99E815
MGPACDTFQTSGKAPPQRVRGGFIFTSLRTLFPSPSAPGLRERPSSSQRHLARPLADTRSADLMRTQMSSTDDVLLDDGGERPQLVCVSQAASAEPGAGRPVPRQHGEDTSWVSSARSPLAHRHPFRSLPQVDGGLLKRWRSYFLRAGVWVLDCVIRGRQTSKEVGSTAGGAKGPAGQEKGKLSQPMGKYSQEHMSAILGNTNPPFDFSKVFWCKFIELITIIPDKQQVVCGA